jgi:hypothetical protein
MMEASFLAIQRRSSPYRACMGFVMQVFGKMIQLIATLVQNCININKRDAFVAITGLVRNGLDLLTYDRSSQLLIPATRHWSLLVIVT